MKNEYKEIFDNICPDKELIDFEVLSKKTDNRRKTVAAVCSMFVLLFAIGTAAYHRYSGYVTDETDIVHLIVAYETRKNDGISYHISKELRSGTKTVKIDADVVTEGNMNEMCIYEAKETIFSADEIWEIICGEDRLFKGDSERASVSYPDGSGINFGVSIDETSTKKELVSKGEGYAEGCEISYNDAKKIADKFLKRKEAEGFRFVKGEISDRRFYGRGYSETGFYIFTYRQYADGFPLETVTSDVYSGAASELSIYIDDRGIFYLRMCGLDLVKKKVLNGEIMTADEAVEAVKKSLSDLWLSEYAQVVEIRLEYMLDQTDNGSLELVPCWHFCIDETELKKMSVDIQRENDTNDLCVNAVTGEMFRVENRYPVYQMSDGSILSTWQK
ncbi:MAG: hypothetical protein IJD49_02275 [Clostridia bacterium]|nr:hypothetical protein [Clostridia bacterium]